jgi:hypothetical protein
MEQGVGEARSAAAMCHVCCYLRQSCRGGASDRSGASLVENLRAVTGQKGNERKK